MARWTEYNEATGTLMIDGCTVEIGDPVGALVDGCEVLAEIRGWTATHAEIGHDPMGAGNAADYRIARVPHRDLIVLTLHPWGHPNEGKLR